MNDSPADILRTALVDARQGSRISDDPDGEWPIFVGHLPGEPDEAVCIYDTDGVRDGRLSRTGENIDHPGFQIRVRASSYLDAIRKANSLAAYIAGIKRVPVVLNGSDYRIHAVTRTGTLVSLGQEQDTRRRTEFTVNGTLTITSE
jgi:hypothetical protein